MKLSKNEWDPLFKLIDFINDKSIDELRDRYRLPILEHTEQIVQSKLKV